MILKQCIPDINSWKVKIFASDVNNDVLNLAKEGIYHIDKIRKLNKLFLRKYFSKTMDKYKREVYVISNELKSMVNFFQHNLLNPLRIRNLDIIFLSNVLIYFDMASKQKVIDNVTNCLNDGGYLFLGQSESLMGSRHSLKFVMPSTFVREA